MKQQRAADEARHTGHAADEHGGDLLETVAYAQLVYHRDRREQPHEMADQKDEDAHVEQVRTQHHLPASQELARLRSPAELVRVEAQDSAHDKDGHGEIGIPSKGEVVDEVMHHACSLPTGRLEALILAVTPVGSPISWAPRT